ncbi:Protein of unknown function [Pyronema omphalodes CBS 100304]|uniref:Uncharacterized protein n=1 Tax=Pyronema omphalodes (strain CBS 100304) TaxID=1076935 RepID=U4LKH3_PYROM|nr:Protein of unknown function [Pyronema omphalodes CBS 100304]
MGSNYLGQVRHHESCCACIWTLSS